MLELKLFKYIAAGIIVLALLASIVGGVWHLYNKVYKSGFDAAMAEVTLKLETERARQQQIMDRIQSSHKEDIAGLERQNDLLEQAFNELQSEATKEQLELEKKLQEAIEKAKESGQVVVVDRPVGLAPSSVRRLNKIR